jgi:cytochrome P450
MTLDVLAVCIFGQDFDTLNGNLSGPLAAYNYVMECLSSPILLLFPWYSSLPLPSNFKLKQKTTEFDDYCWSVIANAKKNDTNQTKVDDSKCISLLQLMINANINEQDIRDNLSLFFLAGHETTASTLSWAIGLLASYPEIQKKARTEVLEKTQNGLTYESLKDLEYIDWFIHETMRMYPAAPVFGQRSLNTETTIGDWKIPEKTLIQIDVVSMLYNPQIWGDPRTFRPERWSPENLTKDQRSVWMPFSYGPRICIGMTFSLLEQKIFLATILREFSCIQLSKNGSLEVHPRGFLNLPDPDKLKINFVNTIQ